MNTAAAMVVPGAPPHVLEIDGSRYFPSLVYRDLHAVDARNGNDI
jgi:hypothetical protein